VRGNNLHIKKLETMINANNIEELINLEIQRAHMALNQGLTRTAQKHIARAKELNLAVATL
tara:strand:- start:686 stop:868 length:183 start_codon:yes stop_codon:yes gene_type:complete